MIELHQKAKENFNEKATELLSFVEPVRREENNEEFSSQSELYVSHTITKKDIIGEVNFSYTDGFGEDKGKAFHYNEEIYGLVGESYQTLLALARKVHSVKELSSLISIEYIKDSLFSWIKISYIQGKTVEFTDYLLQGLKKVVVDNEIWLPVPFTRIGKSFKLGYITFSTITEETIEKWFAFSNAKEIDDNDTEEKLKQLKLNIKKEFQGYAAGIFSCQAEVSRAEELAYEHFTMSLSLLRIFSEANLAHEILNGAYEYGHKMIRSKVAFIRKDGVINYTRGLVDTNLYWNFNSENIDWMVKTYSEKLNLLLCKEKLNNFQQKLLESLIVYSKNILRYEVSDKILYTLVALETILLRNSSEPIQQNVGERLAFVVGQDATERKNIVKIFKDIYAVRSKFVHHGESVVDNSELLRSFYLKSWLFFLSLVEQIDKYNTKEEFLDHIDMLKFS